MVEKHIMELLIEANKNLSSIIDQLTNEKPPFKDRQDIIDKTNSIIRQLDNVVEILEK